MSYMGFRT